MIKQGSISKVRAKHNTLLGDAQKLKSDGSEYIEAATIQERDSLAQFIRRQGFQPVTRFVNGSYHVWKLEKKS